MSSPLNILERLVVVLVRSDGPLNVGSVARLCGNFGVGLRLVKPGADRSVKEAVMMAHPSEELLANAPVFGSLKDALTDVALAVATSSKIEEAIGGPWLSVKKAGELLPGPGEKVALVFGNERTGLSVEEAALCPRVVRLPTPGPTESLNLSHSVAVMLTLFAAAADQAREDFRASKASRAKLIAEVMDKLDARGFFKAGERARRSFEPRLQELFDKMDLSERDLVLWRDVLLVLSRAEN
jgi:TrmH family RNA methyltransferase